LINSTLQQLPDDLKSTVTRLLLLHPTNAQFCHLIQKTTEFHYWQNVPNGQHCTNKYPVYTFALNRFQPNTHQQQTAIVLVMVKNTKYKTVLSRCSLDKWHPSYAVCPLNFRFSSSFIGVTSKSWMHGSSPPATNNWPSARKLPLYAFWRKWRNVFNVWTVRWSNTSTYSQQHISLQIPLCDLTAKTRWSSTVNCRWVISAAQKCIFEKCCLWPLPLNPWPRWCHQRRREQVMSNCNRLY